MSIVDKRLSGGCCPFRIKTDTVDEPTKMRVRGPIHPNRGTCTVSHDRSQPCAFCGDEDYCPDLKFQDFCDREWAK